MHVFLLTHLHVLLPLLLTQLLCVELGERGHVKKATHIVCDAMMRRDLEWFDDHVSLRVWPAPEKCLYAIPTLIIDTLPRGYIVLHPGK